MKENKLCLLLKFLNEKEIRIVYQSFYYQYDVQLKIIITKMNS